MSIIPSALLLLTFVFFIVDVVPGDAAMIALGLEQNPVQYAALRKMMGLDQPIHIRYFRWMAKVFQGDLGNSLRTGEPVINILARSIPITMSLVLFSITISLILALPLGILAAVKQKSWMDVGASSTALLGLSIPEFWSALMVIYVFAVVYSLFPSRGWVNPLINPLEGIRHLLLPALVLGFQCIAIVARMTRSSMLEVMRQDYILTARAKGLRERVVLYKHALKNAMVPVTTIVGLLIGGLFGGAVIIEAIFGLNGLSWQALDAVYKRDYITLEGCVLVIVLMYMVCNLAVDIMYAYLDPRVRY